MKALPLLACLSLFSRTILAATGVVASVSYVPGKSETANNAVLPSNSTIELIKLQGADASGKEAMRRIAAILAQSKIRWVYVGGSLGSTICVEPQHADHARYLLAKSLLDRPFIATLLLDTIELTPVAPKDVIAQYELQRAEQGAAANP